MKIIKNMPINERPKERAFLYGINTLSTLEIICILLNTGYKNNDVYTISKEVLTTINDVVDMKDISLNKLMQIKGIGKSKALNILCGIELGKRVYTKSENKNKILNSAEKIWTEYKNIYINCKQEIFYVLYLDNSKKVLEMKQMFIGTINSSVIHPREIFKHAYILSASFIICIHNHPSNNIEPSINDIETTKMLIEIGKMHGIYIIDHIIFTDDNYLSFFEHNIINFK